MMKAVKYGLISIAAVFLVLTLLIMGIFYWISGEELKSFGLLNSSFSYSSKHVLHLENVALRYTQGNLVFCSKVSISNVDDKKLFLTIDDLSVNLKITKFFDKSTPPISVDIAGFNLDLDSMSVDRSFVPSVAAQSGSGFSKFNVFKKIRQLSFFFEADSLLNLNNTNIKDSNIVKDKIMYKLERTSAYQGDLYQSVTTIINHNVHARVELSYLDNKKTSSLSLKASDLPIWLFTKIMPAQYLSPALDRVDKNFLLIGDLNHTHDKELATDSISLKITNKNSGNTGEIKKLLISINNKEDPKVITLEEGILIFNNKGEIALIGDVSHDSGVISKHSKMNLSVRGSGIHLTSISDLWPYGANKATRDWVTSAVESGVINNLNVNLNFQDLMSLSNDSFKGSFSFDNLDLKYSENFKAITNIKGEAHINLNSLTFRIEEGTLMDSKVYDSIVKVVYSDQSVPLIINLNAEGKVRDFIHLIGEENIQSFNKRGIKIQEAGGTTSAKISLEIPLTQQINVDNIKLSVIGDIRNLNVKFSNVMSIKSGNLDLKVTNDLVSIIGTSVINDQPSRFEWTTYLKKQHQYFDNRLVINGYIGNAAEFEKLFAGKFDIQEGEVLTNVMYMNKGDTEKIIVQFYLDEAKFAISDIGLVKEKGVPSSFHFELEKEEEGNWKTTRFDLTSDDINIRSDLELTPEFKFLYLHSNIKYIGNDFTINVMSNDEKVDIKIHGPKVKFDNANLLNLTNLGVYQHYFSDVDKPKEDKDKKLLLSIQIDDAVMKNGVKFHNIIGNIECYQRQCVNSGLSIDLGEKNKLKIALRHEHNSNKWIFTATNAADFLRAFDIYNDIEGGALHAEVQSISPEHVTASPGNIFSGHMKIENFSAVKTPVIAKLLLSSPFTTLTKASKSSGLMYFNALELNFVFSFLNNTLKVNRSYARGELLNITADGYIDIKNEKLNIKGTIIPHYKINDLSYSFSTSDHPAGPIGTTYSIIGSTKKPNISVNPVGLLVTILLKLPGLGFIF